MRSKVSLSRDCKGFTLLEILVTIVVLGIAATAILGVFTSTIRGSADPLLQQQAVAIAEAYLEEIQLKAFTDPTGDETGESRANFDDIDDYDGLIDAGARDQNDNPIAALASFNVQVSVQGRSITGSDSVPASDALRIDVTVDHPAIDPIVISGFRTNF